MKLSAARCLLAPDQRIRARQAEVAVRPAAVLVVVTQPVPKVAKVAEAAEVVAAAEVLQVVAVSDEVEDLCSWSCTALTLQVEANPIRKARLQTSVLKASSSFIVFSFVCFFSSTDPIQFEC